MNILITGGAGFIGSHVAKEAIKRGMNVVIIDNLSTGKKGNLPKNADFIIEDIRKCNWKKILQNIDIVFHAAAFVSAPESFDYFDECYDINVKATWELINACKANNIKKFIFSSSSAVYPEIDKPNTETDLPYPANPYGLTKLDVECLLEMFKKEYGFSYTALRYFNVYGPRQDKDSEYSAVIPIFINRALKNKYLIIYGTGKQRRDFVYVKDIANAVLSFANNDICGVFNVGTGKDINLIELADIIINKTDSSSILRFEDPRPGDVMFSTASLEKQKKNNVWQSKITIEEGLEKTIEFYRKNPDF